MIMRGWELYFVQTVTHTLAAPHYLYLHSPNCVSSLPPALLFFGTQRICAAAWSCPSPAETCWLPHFSWSLPAATKEQRWCGRNEPSLHVSDYNQGGRSCDFIIWWRKECAERNKKVATFHLLIQFLHDLLNLGVRGPAEERIWEALRFLGGFLAVAC